MALNKKYKKLAKMTDEIAKQVWMLTDVNDKKLVIMDWIGEDCNTPEEMKLRNNIQSAKKGEQIDMIVSNMLLKTHGMGSRY